MRCVCAESEILSHLGSSHRCDAYQFLGPGPSFPYPNSTDSASKLRASSNVLIGTYSVGAAPSGIAFDGDNIWVTNYASNTVTKFFGSNPLGIAFDDTNIWVTNYADNTVTKLRASSGALVGTYNVGLRPKGIAFDGSSIWVANYGSNTATKIPAH